MSTHYPLALLLLCLPRRLLLLLLVTQGGGHLPTEGRVRFAIQKYLELSGGVAGEPERKHQALPY